MTSIVTNLVRLLGKLKWIIIAVWIVMAIVGGMSYIKLMPILTGGGWEVEGTYSQAQKLLSEGFVGRGPTSMVLVVQDPENEVGTPKYSKNLNSILEQLKKENYIKSVFTYLDAPDQAKEKMVGKDRHTSIGFVAITLDEDTSIKKVPDMQKHLKEKAKEVNVNAYLEGTATVWGDVTEYSEKGLFRTEIFVIPLIFIILLLVFKSLMSAITPLIVTLTSVVSSMCVIYLIASNFQLSVFVTNIVVMLGLGLGIDYSLFIVSRYRIELEKDSDKWKALSNTLTTAGHAVLFSGITVMAAMAALLVVNITAIRSIAIGGISVVLMSILSSLILLPAFLLLLGKRINLGSIERLLGAKRESRISWQTVIYKIMKRPVLVILITVGVLIAAAIPALHMKTFTPDATILPEDSEARQAFDLTKETFGVGSTAVIQVVVSTNNGDCFDDNKLQYFINLNDALKKKLKDYKSITSVLSLFNNLDNTAIKQMLSSDMSGVPVDVRTLMNRYVSEKKDKMIIDIEPNGTVASDVSRDIIKTIKEEIGGDLVPIDGLKVSIGGQSSLGIDVNEVLQGSFLKVFFIMLALIFIILLITFRSMFLPLKAIFMNILSAGASYGILVFVFADGHGASLFNVNASGYIQNFVPLLLLALLFSLSTDYEVFLLSRVKEEYEASKDNDKSVIEGVKSTAPLITGAAILMVAVFGGFAFSYMLPIQTIGFGMAVAIALDASLIRFVLVPATMKLLGHWNWWFPIRKKESFKA